MRNLRNSEVVKAARPRVKTGEGVTAGVVHGGGYGARQQVRWRSVEASPARVRAAVLMNSKNLGTFC